MFGLATSQIATDVLAAEGLTARNVTRWLATQDRLAAGPGAGGPRPVEGDERGGCTQETWSSSTSPR